MYFEKYKQLLQWEWHRNGFTWMKDDATVSVTDLAIALHVSRSTSCFLFFSRYSPFPVKCYFIFSIHCNYQACWKSILTSIPVLSFIKTSVVVVVTQHSNTIAHTQFTMPQTKSKDGLSTPKHNIMHTSFRKTTLHNALRCRLSDSGVMCLLGPAGVVTDSHSMSKHTRCQVDDVSFDCLLLWCHIINITSFLQIRASGHISYILQLLSNKNCETWGIDY